jgi:hypothetical protein
LLRDLKLPFIARALKPFLLWLDSKTPFYCARALKNAILLRATLKRPFIVRDSLKHPFYCARLLNSAFLLRAALKRALARARV